MAADFVVRYASFLGGDWGNRDASRAKENQYRGENVKLFESGLLGVRNGLKKLDVADMPVHTDGYGPKGVDIWKDNVVVVLDKPYLINLNGDHKATLMGEFPKGPPTTPSRMAQYRQDLYFNHSGYIFKYNGSAITEITLPAKLKGLTRWNYYLLAWDEDNPQRLYFTEVGEFGAQPDDWGVNNFLDIGGNEPITALLPMYNTLYLAKQSGWYQVSGVLGDRPYVRRIANGNGPADDRVAAVTTDNRVLYWGPDNTPVWFNGEVPYMDKEFRVESLETYYPSDSVAASVTGRHNLMLGEPSESFDDEDAATAMLEYDSGRWSTHTFNGVKMGGIAGHDLRTTIDKPANTMFMVNRPETVGQPVELYSYGLAQIRVGNNADKWSAASDVSHPHLLNGYVEFPAYYDAQSRLVMVRNLVIQFRHWQSGVEHSKNELQVQYRPMGRYEGGTIDTKPQLWVENSDDAEDGGTDVTWRIGMGKYGWANGFQIVFPVMRGVALRSIEAHVEVRSARL